MLFPPANRKVLTIRAKEPISKEFTELKGTLVLRPTRNRKVPRKNML